MKPSCVTSRRLVVAGLIGAGATFGVAGRAADATCMAIAQQTDATVIAYEPSSTFTICRSGKVETDVVAGRPIYVELVAVPGIDLFHFRVQGRGTAVEPTGLQASAERMERLHETLHALGASSETIAEAAAAQPGSAGAVEESRALYEGVVTRRFEEALSRLTAPLEALPAEADVLARWCVVGGDARGASAPLLGDLRRLCGDARISPAPMKTPAAGLALAVDRFRAARDVAREALVAARARPDDPPAQSAAAAALDEARRKALDVVEGARRLDPLAQALRAKALLLREIVRESPGALRPGVPYYLTRFSRGGIGTLQIESAPIDLAPGVDAPGKDAPTPRGLQTFSFPVVSLHFLDIEAGIASANGPTVPALGTQNQIVAENVDGFVGLALVELEPARFLWPDRPLAGLLRFPVVGIPFTRDPSRNFFAGVGLGWTGIGSISGGPYLLRELALDSGSSYGETLPKGASLESVASPELRVGYFVSASVDLVGLVHLFVQPHEPVLDATTGTEVH